MTRTYKTIRGLTYRALDVALTELGYKRHEQNGKVTYNNSKDEDALLLFPPQPMDSEVRGIDFIAARSVVDSFGIMDAKNFDLLLLRHASMQIPVLNR